MNTYQQQIRLTMARIGQVGTADPRHVEAWMRLEHDCLDGLSRAQFASEVEIALQCIAASTTTQNEALARSMGL